MTTSQIMRPTFVSPSLQGIIRYVPGSGMATMSDSSIALNPVIDEPSKPMPSSSAAGISLGVTAKLLRCPSRSVNHRSRNSTPSAFIFSSASLRASSLDVARFFDSTCCAMLKASLNAKSPGRHARGSVASHVAAAYQAPTSAPSSSSSGSPPSCPIARP